MIRIIIAFIIVATSISLAAQNKSSEQFQDVEFKQLEIYKQNSVYNDTMWVCDSIIHFAVEDEKYGKHEVLSRNILGNETLSEYTMMFNPPGIYDYPFVDSTNYFIDNENVENKAHNVFIASSSSWETSQYFHYKSPDVEKDEYYKYYSSSTQEFNGGYKKYYVYTNSRPDTLFTYYFINNSSWQNQSYQKYFYDDFGNNTLQMHYRWKNNTYVDSLKQQRIYNSENLIHRYDLKWDINKSNWQNYTHMYYSYNVSGLEDTILQQSWDTMENIWRDEAMSVITYDQNDKIITYLTKVYDYTSQQLENYIISTNIYENNNHTIIYKLWENNEWENYSQHLYSYKAENKIDTSQMDLWDPNSNIWISSYRYVTQYDTHDNVMDMVREHFTNNAWELYTRYIYYWSAFFPNSITETSTNAIAVYPNPASTKVSFILKEVTSYPKHSSFISIYNLSGQKIGEFPMIDGNFQWNCSAKEPGLYIYSTIINGINYSGKIVVAN
jgi:hypothetical protein